VPTSLASPNLWRLETIILLKIQGVTGISNPCLWRLGLQWRGASGEWRVASGEWREKPKARIATESTRHREIPCGIVGRGQTTKKWRVKSGPSTLPFTAGKLRAGERGEKPKAGIATESPRHREIPCGIVGRGQTKKMMGAPERIPNLADASDQSGDVARAILMHARRGERCPSTGSGPTAPTIVCARREV
jgi:hypothetical protein